MATLDKKAKLLQTEKMKTQGLMTQNRRTFPWSSWVGSQNHANKTVYNTILMGRLVPNEIKR